MKKILLTLACVFGMNIAASAEQGAVVMLEHNGKITTFEADQINDAMEAAADGDVLFLTEGTFPMFNVTKKVTIKGTGERTKINGDVNIAIPDTPILSDNLLEFLYIKDKVTVTLPLKGMRIKQCWIGQVDFTANTYDSYIDRCKIYNLLMEKTYKETIVVNGESQTITSAYVKGLTVTNTIIEHIANGINQYTRTLSYAPVNQNTSFINCLLENLGYCGGTVINSIINGSRCIDLSLSSGVALANVTATKFVNTYYVNEIQGSNFIGEGNFNEFTNCYATNETLDYETADLTALGYKGNDGTIIGPMGGNTPFTLVPTVPRVTEASMKVDPKKQELNATLTVSPK